MGETQPDLREALARAIFERGRKQGGIDPETWEVAGDEMQAWLLGHADAMIAGPFAPILAQVSALQAEVKRLREELSVEAPEEVLGPEWGRNAFSAVLGDGYTPKVWGKHRALHHSALREALELAADIPKVQDVIAWQIWRSVVDGNRSHHAFKMAAEAQERLQKVEGERDAALNAAAILLPFVDMAAGEGLEWSEQECGSPRMDAADLCIQAAEALGFDLGDDRYAALLKQGEDAIRSARSAVTETKEGSEHV